MFEVFRRKFKFRLIGLTAGTLGSFTTVYTVLPSCKYVKDFQDVPGIKAGGPKAEMLQ